MIASHCQFNQRAVVITTFLYLLLSQLLNLKTNSMNCGNNTSENICRNKVENTIK